MSKQPIKREASSWRWTIQDEQGRNGKVARDNTPFSLIMVKSDYFAQLKGKLTQTSTDGVKAKYKQPMRELAQQKKAGMMPSMNWLFFKQNPTISHVRLLF